MTGSRGVIAVLGKQPTPGRVKTRLVPPFSPRQACELYTALLRDALEVTGAIAAELSLDAVLAVAPPEAVRALAGQVPTPFCVIPQRGGNLGERMDWAVREAAAGGARRVVLRGSDSPVLDGGKVSSALEALDEFDLAICPDLDGGYNMIALRGPAPGLFEHPMSTRNVLADTLEAAAAAGLRAHVLEPSFDIDRAADLAHLATVRSDPGVSKLCRRTLAYLDQHRLWDLATE